MLQPHTVCLSVISSPRRGVSAAHADMFPSSTYSHTDKSMTSCSYIQETKGQSRNTRPNVWGCVTGDAEMRGNLCWQNVRRLDHGVWEIILLPIFRNTFSFFRFFSLSGLLQALRVIWNDLVGQEGKGGFLRFDNPKTGVERFNDDVYMHKTVLFWTLFGKIQYCS